MVTKAERIKALNARRAEDRARVKMKRRMPNRDPVTNKFMKITPENPGVMVSLKRKRGESNDADPPSKRRNTHQSENDQWMKQTVPRKPLPPIPGAPSSPPIPPPKPRKEEVLVGGGGGGGKKKPRKPYVRKPAKAPKPRKPRAYQPKQYPGGCAEGQRFVCRPAKYNKKK